VITTDATNYSLGQLGGVATLRIVVENQGAQTLYVVPLFCGLVIQSKQSNGTWSAPQTCGDKVVSTPVVANGQLADSMFVHTPGTYRMALPYGTDSAQIATKQSTSNTFVVSK